MAMGTKSYIKSDDRENRGIFSEITKQDLVLILILVPPATGLMWGFIRVAWFVLSMIGDVVG
jgi:hypothetical protein